MTFVEFLDKRLARLDGLLEESNITEENYMELCRPLHEAVKDVHAVLQDHLAELREYQKKFPSPHPGAEGETKEG